MFTCDPYNFGNTKIKINDYNNNSSRVQQNKFKVKVVFSLHLLTA